MTTWKSDAVKAGLMPDYSRAGVVLCRTGVYYTDAQDEIVSGDTIQMVPIPKNAQILDVVITAKLLAGTLAFEGASGCHVGDGACPSRFMDDASLGNAIMLCIVDDGRPASIGYTYDEGEDTIDIAVKKAATVNQTYTTIIMNVYYKMAGSISDEDLQTYNAAAG